ADRSATGETVEMMTALLFSAQGTQVTLEHGDKGLRGQAGRQVPHRGNLGESRADRGEVRGDETPNRRPLRVNPPVAWQATHLLVVEDRGVGLWASNSIHDQQLNA